MQKFKSLRIFLWLIFLEWTGQLHLAWGATEDPGSANGATDVHSQRAAYWIGYLSSNFKVFYILFKFRTEEKCFIFEFSLIFCNFMQFHTISFKLLQYFDFIVYRYKNYMVALMNKNLIQTTVHLPLAGETNFFSKSLRFNLELIFFRTLINLTNNFIKFKVNNLTKIYNQLLNSWFLLMKNYEIISEISRKVMK